MTKWEAFLLIVAILAVFLSYVWRRLGEPPPKGSSYPLKKETGPWG
jgi:hypothetical protein